MGPLEAKAIIINSPKEQTIRNCVEARPRSGVVCLSVIKLLPIQHKLCLMMMGAEPAGVISYWGSCKFGYVRVFYPLLGPFVFWIEEEGKSGRKFTVVLLGKKSTEGRFSKKVGMSGKASASSFYGD